MLMRRLHMTRKVLFSALIAGCFCVGLFSRPPNIILILADDLGYGDLGCYGQKRFGTPNIDELARTGTRFLNFYAGSTVCAPSRASLLTGIHTGHTTIRGNGTPYGRIPLETEDTTLAMLLKDAGYVTGAIGKWGLGESGSTGVPNRKGFDYWYGFLNQKKAHSYYPDSLWRNGERISLPQNSGGKRAVNIHSVFTEEAAGFIQQHKDLPFFLYLAYTVPHAELVAEPEALEAYRGRFDEVPFTGSASYPENPFPRATYAAMIGQLDRDVGRICQLVDDAGLADSTLIIFTSDNGPEAGGKHGCDPDFFNSTGGLRGVKRWLYEGGLRVPMIFNWKGRIPEGKEIRETGAQWDILATLADLVGTRPPSRTDGRSLLPLISGRKDTLPAVPLYWEFHRPGSASVQAIRVGPWKAVRNLGNGMVELFNLVEDPRESRDVSGLYPEKVLEISPLWSSLRTPSAFWPLQQGGDPEFHISDFMPRDIEPVQAPFHMETPALPAIPDRSLCITDLGAENLAMYRIDQVLAAAIDSMSRMGGGKVIIPEGVWECGPIRLDDHIELHLEEGAQIHFSGRLADYLPAVLSRHQGIECFKFSPLIGAEGKTDIAVTGKGVFHGNGKAWWKYNLHRVAAWEELQHMAEAQVPVKERIFADSLSGFLAPSFVQLMHCKNVLIEGNTFLYGPFWTINPVYCDHVTVRGVIIRTVGAYGRTMNGDGINPSSCRNVLIEYCDLDTGDDCIAVKSGRDQDGTRVNRPTRNVVVRYCQARNGHGGVVIGSETSGGIYNVFVHQCSFVGTDRGIRVKTARGRGASVENIFIRDIRMKRIRDECIVLNMLRYTPRFPAHALTDRTPSMKNIHISNVSCEGAGSGIRLVGLPENPMEKIYLEHITIETDRAIEARDIRDAAFTNLTFRSDQPQPVIFDRCSGLSVSHVRGGPEKMELHGSCEDLVIRDCGFAEDTGKRNVPHEGQP